MKYVEFVLNGTWPVEPPPPPPATEFWFGGGHFYYAKLGNRWYRGRFYDQGPKALWFYCAEEPFAKQLRRVGINEIPVEMRHEWLEVEKKLLTMECTSGTIKT